MKALTRCITVLAIAAASLVTGGPSASADNVDAPSVDVQVQFNLDDHCDSWAPLTIEVAHTTDGEIWAAISFESREGITWEPSNAETDLPEVLLPLDRRVGPHMGFVFTPPTESFTGHVNVYLTDNPAGLGIPVSREPYASFPITVECPEATPEATPGDAPEAAIPEAGIDEAFSSTPLFTG